MPVYPSATYTCPGCGEPVAPHDDYVVALEYEAEPGFSLHDMTVEPTAAVERRFHVEHFRGRLGDRVFLLVPDQGAHAQ